MARAPADGFSKDADCDYFEASVQAVQQLVQGYTSLWILVGTRALRSSTLCSKG